MKTKIILFIELIFVMVFLLGCVTLVNNTYYFSTFDEVVSALNESTDGPESCGGMTLIHLEEDQFEAGFIRDSYHTLNGVGSLQARNAGEISIVHLNGIVSWYEIDDDALAYVIITIGCGAYQSYYNEDENRVHEADELGFHSATFNPSPFLVEELDPLLEVDHPTYEILSRMASNENESFEMNTYLYGHLDNVLGSIIKVTFYYPSSLYQDRLNETELAVLSSLNETIEHVGYPDLTLLATPSNLTYDDGVLSWTDGVNTGDFEYEVILKIGKMSHIFSTKETSIEINQNLISGDILYSFSVQAVSDDRQTIVSPRVTMNLVQNESGVPILTAPIPQNLTMDSPYLRLEWDEVLGVTMYQVKAVIHHRLGGTTTRVYPVLTNHMNLSPSDFAIYVYDEIEFFVRAMGTEDSPEGLLANPLSGNPYTYNSPYSDGISF